MVCTGCCATLDHIVTYLFKKVTNKGEHLPGNYFGVEKIFQGQHWIRLEIQPDVIIQSLKMVVDPADSTYMPSLLVISTGDNLSALKEISTVNVYGTDTSVSLLSSLNNYHKYIEIAIKQCRNGGIDCKVHGLMIQGRRRLEEDEYSSALSFLTSDSEEVPLAT